MPTRPAVPSLHAARIKLCLLLPRVPIGAGFRLAAALLPAVALVACAQQIAEWRVRDALVAGGLAERDARCMAHRMVDRLTIAQLRKLEALRGVDRATLPTMTPAQFVDRLRRVGDAEVVAVVATSGAACALGIG